MRKTLTYLLSITKLDRSVRYYIFAYAMVGLIYVGIQGVLTNLYLIELGLDLEFVGNLTASGMLVWALFSLPAGMIGARIGMRAASIAGFILISGSLALYLCVVLLPRPLWEAGFYLTNTIMWMTASLAAVNGTPYLMAVAPEQERNSAFAFSGALGAAAGFTGSLLAGFLPGYLIHISNGSLDQAGAYNAVLWLSVPAYLLSALLMSKARSAPPVVHEPQTTHGSVHKNRAPLGLLLFLGILFSLQMTSESFVNIFLNIYFAEELLVSTGQIGIIYAVVRLLPFFISPLLPLVLNRWGAGRVMTGGYVLMVGFILFMALFATWQAAAAGFILISLATSFSLTARSIFSQEAVQPRWRTTISAVLIMSLAVATGVAGVVGGRVIPIIGFRGMFLIGATLALLAVLLHLAWYLLSSRRPQLDEPEPAALP